LKKIFCGSVPPVFQAASCLNNRGLLVDFTLQGLRDLSFFGSKKSTVLKIGQDVPGFKIKIPYFSSLNSKLSDCSGLPDS
jgi:hypothetical protein